MNTFEKVQHLLPATHLLLAPHWLRHTTPRAGDRSRYHFQPECAAGEGGAAANDGGQTVCTSRRCLNSFGFWRVNTGRFGGRQQARQTCGRDAHEVWLAVSVSVSLSASLSVSVCVTVTVIVCVVVSVACVLLLRRLRIVLSFATSSRRRCRPPVDLRDIS